MGYMFAPLRKYFQFDGRSRRMEYWSFMLLAIVVALVVFGGLGGMAGVAASNNEQPTGAFIGLSVILYLLYFIVFGLPSIALTVRRLHDQDKSGWLYLLNFVPVANIVLLIFMFLPGTVGPNQYGPDPKQLPGA